MAFVTVTTSDDLPIGKRIVAEVDGIWVVIFNVDGTYHALQDLCTHEEEYLSEGELYDGCIECPAHGATFNLKTGAATMPAVRAVPVYAVREENGNVQVDVTHQLNA